MLRRINFKSWKVRLVIIVIILFGTTGAVYFKKNFTYLLSPGHLSTYHKGDVLIAGVSSHAEIEKKCSHCHAPIHCVTDTRCQDCHKEIAQQREDPNSLHGRLPGTQQCQNCHPEHQGADANLTKFSFQNVDHYLLSDFSIEKHKINHDGFVFTCTTCHTQSGDRLQTIDCVSCHSKQDHNATARHIEEYGARCFDCHDGKDRMVADTFDHNTTFVLDGAHGDKTCADCHAQTYFAGKSTTCSTCHEDPKVHLGKFGLDCERCHSAVAWTPAELRKHAFSFDHGDEVIETCETCHTSSTYTVYSCEGCHEKAEMDALHVSVKIVDSKSCSTCHITGLKAEIPLRPEQVKKQPTARPGTLGSNNPSAPGGMYKPVSTPSSIQTQGKPGMPDPNQNRGSEQNNSGQFRPGDGSLLQLTPTAETQN